MSVIYFVFRLRRYAEDLARIAKAGWTPLSIAASSDGDLAVLASHGDVSPFRLAVCWMEHLSTAEPILVTYYDPEARCSLCGKQGYSPVEEPA